MTCGVPSLTPIAPRLMALNGGRSDLVLQRTANASRSF